MESLESRMERLTTDQKKEVEDFVDFLLLKNNFRQDYATNPPVSQAMMNTPPVLSADPASPVQQSPLRMQDLVIHEEPHLPVISPDSVPSPVHEITAGSDDRITHDYMDYGRFEEDFSPAKEAVKNVKRKIITRETEDKSSHLLDWVD